MVKFRCGHCKQKMGVPDEYAGRRVRCPRCKNPQTVPRPQEIAEVQSVSSQATAPAAQPTEAKPSGPPVQQIPPLVEEPVAAPPPPSFASIFSQQMPTGADPRHASMNDLWDERLTHGPQPGPTHDEAANLSQTIEVPRLMTAEVIDAGPPRPAAPARSSQDEVNDLLRDLRETQLPADE